MGFLGAIGHFIMTPLYYLVSAVLVGFHKVLSGVFGSDSALTWTLSIIGLTLVIRAALIPLFVKQIKSSRNMQLLQPKVKELQKKYGHDRERLTQETMKLYKETGTNPFASCLPLLIQMPIFFALFRLIDHAAKNFDKASYKGQGFLSKDLATSFAHAPFFGGTLSSSFTHDGGHTSIKIIAAVLVLAMTATTFMTQRQLMAKNMPADAMTGQYAQQQKMLLYVLPVVFGVGGIAFPLGVIIYWTTSNLWTMCQQFYVIRNNPAPGTPAFEAKKKRDAAKGKPVTVGVEERSESGSAAGDTSGSPANSKGSGGKSGSADRRPAQRQQPKNQSRQQRKKK